MDQSSKLVSEIYRFNKYDLESKNALYDSLSSFYRKGGSLLWPKLRSKLLLPLMGYVLEKQLTEEDEKLLIETEKNFNDIASQDYLDLCLMFWQVTGDEKYVKYIKKAQNSQDYILSKCATIILDLNHIL